MPYKFASQGSENSARAVSLNLPISTKHSVETCRAIRKMPLEQAKAFLEAVISKKRAVPFKRFNKDMGHKRGMAAGRYPIKACKYILNTLKSAESNAADKGLLLDGLVVVSIVPQKAARPMKYGRHRSRKAKRTHIEVVLEETKMGASSKKSKDEPVGKQEKKAENPKPTTKTPEPKTQKPATKTPEPKTQKPATKTPEPKTQKPAVKTPEPKTQKPATKTPEPKTQKPATKIMEKTENQAKKQKITGKVAQKPEFKAKVDKPKPEPKKK